MAEMTQAERDEFRALFLLGCWRKFGTGRAPEADGGLVAVGRELAQAKGYDPSAADEAYLFWARRGCIKPTMQGGGYLTTAGEDAAEQLQRKIEEAEAPGPRGPKIGF